MTRWMARLPLALGVLLGAFVSSLAAAQTPPAFTAGQPVEVEGARFHDFRSAINGRRYRLFIYAPQTPPPAGFPVVYVLDGNVLFQTAVGAARAGGMFGELRPAVIVGVGYPLADPLEILKTRNRDLTTPVTAEALARMPPNPGLTPDNTGGLDAFLDVLDREVKPFVASQAKVDAGDQTLIGHSLGGLAVVRALMTRPGAYRTFVSASPSLFWNDRAVLKDLPALEARIRAGQAAPRVLLMAGSLEGSPTGYRTGPERLTQTQVDALIAGTAMVDNPRRLAAELQGVPGRAPYRVAVTVFADESHLSVMPAAISRGLNFALSTYGDGPPPRATGP